MSASATAAPSDADLVKQYGGSIGDEDLVRQYGGSVQQPEQQQPSYGQPERIEQGVPVYSVESQLPAYAPKEPGHIGKDLRAIWDYSLGGMLGLAKGVSSLIYQLSPLGGIEQGVQMMRQGQQQQPATPPLQRALAPVIDPNSEAAKMISGIVRSHLETGAKADQALKEGRYLEALGYGTAASWPGMGPGIADIAETATGSPPELDTYGRVTKPGQEADPEKAVAQLVGVFLSLGLGKLLPKGMAAEEELRPPAGAPPAGAPPPGTPPPPGPVVSPPAEPTPQVTSTFRVEAPFEAPPGASQPPVKGELPGGTPLVKFGSRYPPVQQAAIDYLRREGVPLTPGQITGNRYLRAIEASTAHMPYGSEAAEAFRTRTSEALTGLSTKLAEQAYPTPVTPYEAGEEAGTALRSQIADLNEQENTAYQRAWQDAENPDYVKEVPIRSEFDDEGNLKTTMGKVALPVDVRWMKVIANQELPKLEYLPAAEQAQSAAVSIFKKILSGPDYISAPQAEEALKGLKGEARGAAAPELRTYSQGMAAGMIPKLQAGIDAALAEAGPEAVEGLQSGRRLHFEKMQVADIANKLREEPVQAFNQMSMARDAGVKYLNQIAEQAPDIMPRLGRAYLDNLFDIASREGTWSRATGILKSWQNLGPRTKTLMFPNGALRKGLDRFFLGQNIISRDINPSGTALVQAAQHATTNPLAWTQGILGSKMLFSPRGMAWVLKGVENPPATAAAGAEFRSGLENIVGEEPPETPPEGPGGGAPPAAPPPTTPSGGGAPPAAPGGGGAAAPIPEATAGPAAPGSSLYQRLQDIADQAFGRIRQRGSLFGRTQFNAVPIPDIKDMVLWGAAKMGQGIVDPAAFRQALIERYGKLPRDLMNEVLGRSKTRALRDVEDYRLGMPLDDIHPLTSETIPLNPDVEPSLSKKNIRLYSGHEQGAGERNWMPSREEAEAPLAKAQAPSQLSYLDVKPGEAPEPGEAGRKLMIYTPGELPERATGLLTEDVQRYLQDMVRKRLGDIPDDAPDSVKMRRLLRYGRSEFADQLQQPYSGVDWYGPDTAEADRLLRQVRPELADADFDTIQKAMSAAMSNNSNPQAEGFNGARIWEQAYDNWKKGSPLQFPELQPNGKNWPAQGANFQIAKLNLMLRELGVHGTAEFLNDPEVVGRAIKHFVPNAKEIRLNETFPGSQVLGPKIGVYFNQIMNHPLPGSVVDVWMMRRLGRILGRLFDDNGNEIDAPRTEGERQLSMDLDSRMAKENNVATRDAQSVGWHYEQELYRRLGLNVKSYRRSQGIQKYLDSLEAK